MPPKSKAPKMSDDELMALFERMSELYPGADREPPTKAEAKVIKEVGQLLGRVQPGDSDPNFAQVLAKIPDALKTTLSNIEDLCAHSRQNTGHLSSEQKRLYRHAIEQAASPLVFKELGADVLENTKNKNYGNLWKIGAATRSYVRLLSDICYYEAEKGDWNAAAKWGLLCMAADAKDNCKLRDRIGGYLVTAERYEEAVNFCMNWLLGGFPVKDGGLGNNEWVKEEFRPKYPASNLQKRTKESIDFSGVFPNLIFSSPDGKDHHALIYNLAVALFYLNGKKDSNLATSAVIQGNILNAHTARLILADPSTYPKEQYTCPRNYGSKEEASDYLFFTQSSWRDPAVRAWLRELSGNDEIAAGRMRCGQCETLEPKIGDFMACAACFGFAFYCGSDCQKKDWGDHRKKCKMIREMREKAQQNAGWQL